MKTYYTHTQGSDTVYHDTQRRCSFLNTSPLYTAMTAEVNAGTSQVLPAPAPTYKEIRLSRYLDAGLTPDGWLEAVVEFLGTLPNQTTKFAQQWAIRQQIRAAVPSS